MVIRKDHGEGLLAQGAYLHTLGRREGLLPQVGRLGAALAPGDAIPLLQILPGLPAVGHGQLHLLHPGAEGQMCIRDRAHTKKLPPALTLVVTM